jgi:ATP-dependent 26S proteasome regulatory subunit
LELLSKITELTSRKSNNVADKLTLSCLLNIFDGILETPGRIIILTTNYPDRIDKELLRPGRIDINIELKKASSDTINKILSSFYDVDTKNIIFEDYILTPATVSNICLENKNDINNSILIIKKLIDNILNK